jgi:6-phosphogluconolactonase
MGSAKNPGLPYAIAVAPSGLLAYAGNTSPAYNSLYMYQVDLSSGSLFPTGANSGVPTGGVSPRTLAIDPSGRFVYVVNDGDDSISTFRITPLPQPQLAGPTLPTGRVPRSVAVDAAGKFVYVANSGDNTVSIFTIDAASGVLTAAGSVATGAAPNSVMVDPSNKFVYVANEGEGSVSIYAMGANGGLTSTGDATSVGASPSAIAMTGVYPPPLAYVANYNDGTISAFQLDPVTGAPTNVGTVQTVAYPQNLTVDPQGRFLYSPYTGSPTVLQFAIDPIAGTLTSAGSIPAVASFVAFDPTGEFAYVTRGSSLSAYAVDSASGELQPIMEVDAPYGSESVVDPSGSFVYAMTNNGWTLSTYAIDRDNGALALIDRRSIPSESGHIAIDPYGRFLYTTMANTTVPAVNAFTIDPLTGVPAFSGGCRTQSSGTLAPVIDPSGRFGVTSDNKALWSFAIDQGTGTLTPVSAVSVPDSPSGSISGIAIDPSGKLVYGLTNFTTNRNKNPGVVIVFALDASTGALTRVEGLSAPTGVMPQRIVVTPGKGEWISISVAASASPGHVVGVNVSGLSGTLVLTDNGGDDLTMRADGTFAFATRIPEGGSYDVEAKSQPAGQSCAVSGGQGTMGAADVLSVGVVCTTNGAPTTYAVSAAVSGLTGGTLVCTTAPTA